MRIRLLGPVEALVEGGAITVGAGKPRALLALLALHAGEVVTTDQLVDGLWPEGRAPASAPKMVQLYVSQLRKLGVPIRTRGRGYELELDPDDVDALRFEGLVRDGAGAEALELWAGRPLQDAAGEPFAAQAIRRLDDLHVEAREQAIDAALRRGEHRAVLTDVEALVVGHPLRERLHALRMLALYRSGRQADALEAFRQARSILVEEVGIEPGPELRELHDRILRQDPELGTAAPSTWATAGRPLFRGYVAVGIGMLLLGTVVIALTRPGDEGSLAAIEGDAVGLVDPEDGRITAQYGVGEEPTGIAGGAASVWVANGQDGTVSRIERERDQVTTIDVGGEPVALAYGENALWVADAESRSLLQVDPARNRVVERFTVGNTPRAVAVGAGAVWVASSIDDRVDRIDLATGQTRRLVVAGGPAAVAVDDDAAWVATELGGQVVRLDPHSGVTVASLAVGRGPSAVAIADDGVWVLNRADATLSRVRPEGAAVDATVPIGGRPAALAAGDGSVWVGDAEEAGRLVEVRSDTRRVERTVAVGGSPAAITLVDGGLWVATVQLAAARRGGTLAYRTGEFFCRCFDPAGYDGRAWPLLALVYDGLTSYRRAGGVAGTVIVANLAERLPEPADGGRRWTFRLREGLRFSDGRPVRASDFRASIERVYQIDPVVNEALFGGVVGADRCTRRACDLSRGIAIDDAARTISIRLRAPDLEFLHKLAIPNAWVVPADSPVELAAERPLVGTGPYRVAEIAVERGGRLERVPGFESWSPDARPQPFADAVEWTISTNPDDDIEAIKSGTADIMPATGFEGVALPNETIRALALRDPRLVRSSPQANTAWFFLNTREPPFDDVRVRRAFNFALNRARLVELLGGEHVGTLTCQVVPAGLPGYEPRCPYTVRPSAGGAWIAPDMARARRLVAAAGTRGTPVTFFTFDGPFSPFVEHAADVMRRLGYPARARVVASPDRFFAMARDPGQHMQSGAAGWIADFLTPSSFFELNFTCRMSGPRITNNLPRFCDPTVDEAVVRATAEGGSAWATVDRRVVDAAAVAPTVNQRSVVLVSDRVGALEQHPILGPLLDQSWLR